jgi:tetratricopeptide (TPR) repeat protein
MRAVDSFERANRIFVSALELPPAMREAYLREAAGGDRSLQDSLLDLLSRFNEPGDFLERSALGRPLSTDLPPGTVLADRFRIDLLLGKGGMGEVYLADDLVLGEAVALKTIRSEWRSDPTMLDRFRQELKLARRIAHPNVCRIFDLFTAAGPDGTALAFFTMEYLAGQPLSERLRGGKRLDTVEVLRIGEKIAAGIDAAHAAGVVHGDLKPGNILLGGEAGERPAITDFGLARPAEPPSGATTQTGIVAGSPDYMAPEQFLGKRATPASDVYALAMIVYEMTAGVRAYPSENLVQAAVRRVTSSPMPLSQAAPDAPAHWSAPLERALAREPERRPRSARELMEELRAGPGRKLAGRRWRPSRRAVVWSAAAAATMASVAAFRRFPVWSGTTPAILMLTPMVTSNDAETAGLLHLQIEQGLLQSGRVRVLSPERVRAAWERMGRRPPVPRTLTREEAMQMARRAGADGVVFSELAWTGSEWSLKTQLAWTTGIYGQTATGRFYAEDRRGLMVAAARAADWLRRNAGEKEPMGRPPEEVTTSNWEALQEFGLARDSWNARPGEGAWPPDQREAAEAHLARALELDPKFAAAAGLLADIQMAANQVDEAMLTYERASRLIDERNLTDRESLMIRGQFALDSGQFSKAEEVFSRFAEKFPADPLPLFYKARAVELLGNEEGCLRLHDMAARMAPQNYAFVSGRGIHYLLLGRVAEARADCERAANLNDTDWTDRLRSALGFAAWNIDATWGPLEHMKAAGSVSQRGAALALEAALRAEQNRLPEALALIEEAVRVDVRNNQPAVVTNARLRWKAALLLRQGRRAEAVEVCRGVLAGGPGIRERLDTGALLAQAGDMAGAAACLPAGVWKEPPRLPPAGPPPGSAPQLVWPIYWRRILRLWAEIAMARGAFPTAIALLRNAPPPEVAQEWPDALVRASVGSGETAPAAQILTKLYRNPAGYWSGAELSPPGFLRQGVEQGKMLNLPGAPWRRLETFLNSN